MRIIALIDERDVAERILKHLSVWDTPPEPRFSAGRVPPLPKGETLHRTSQPLPDIA